MQLLRVNFAQLIYVQERVLFSGIRHMKLDFLATKKRGENFAAALAKSST